jgi:hypothetical protein
MTNEEIKKILELHKKWLNNEEGGLRTNLSDANLRGVDLSGTNLTDAILTDAILSDANLRGANLRGVDLRGAILSDANLIGAILSEKDKNRLGVILSKTRVGYKKLANGIICKLSIPKGAIVFCINGSKCRTNKCEVLEGEGVSQYDNETKYKVGKTLKIKNFDLMYNVECSTGIHFFWTKKEARNY